jgi:hypothetical protein
MDEAGERRTSGGTAALDEDGVWGAVRRALPAAWAPSQHRSCFRFSRTEILYPARGLGQPPPGYVPAAVVFGQDPEPDVQRM